MKKRKKKKSEEDIIKQIKTVESLLLNTDINVTTSEYFLNLLKIYQELYNFLYFKMYQEDYCLNPSEEKNEKEKQKNN